MEHLVVNEDRQGRNGEIDDVVEKPTILKRPQDELRFDEEQEYKDGYGVSEPELTEGAEEQGSDDTIGHESESRIVYVPDLLSIENQADNHATDRGH